MQDNRSIFCMVDKLGKRELDEKKRRNQKRQKKIEMYERITKRERERERERGFNFLNISQITTKK